MSTQSLLLLLPLLKVDGENILIVKTGAYFSGYGVRDVNEYYSESSEWSLLVEEMMAQIGCID